MQQKKAGPISDPAFALLRKLVRTQGTLLTRLNKSFCRLNNVLQIEEMETPNCRPAYAIQRRTSPRFLMQERDLFT